MSGSGRQSSHAYMSGLVTSCPRDFRCGWGLRRKTRREQIDKLDEVLASLAEFYSPKCSPWSAATVMKEASKVDARVATGRASTSTMGLSAFP